LEFKIFATKSVSIELSSNASTFLHVACLFLGEWHYMESTFCREGDLKTQSSTSYWIRHPLTPFSMNFIWPIRHRLSYFIITMLIGSFGTKLFLFFSHNVKALPIMAPGVPHIILSCQLKNWWWIGLYSVEWKERSIPS
jgi:hypothetical protein